MTQQTNTVYRISRHVLGAGEILEISQSEYAAITAARKSLAGIVDFEEKFYAISESFFDLERFIFESKFHDLLYFGSNSDGLLRLRIQFSRRLLSILTIFRLYRDSMCKGINTISGGAVQNDQVETIFSKQYNVRYNYRVMEAIRNYSQHDAIPAHAARTQAKWNDDSTENSFGLEFFFKVNKIERMDKFKAAVRKEIEKQGGEVELVNATRGYFFGICAIHSDLRSVIAPHRNRAIALLDEWRTKWRRQHPNAAISALAAGIKREGRVDPHTLVWLDPAVDQYREFLEERTRHLRSMDKRKISP